MGTMEPVSGERFFTRSRFGLCNFVVVVHRNMFYTTGVYINLFSKNIDNHGRTLDVPTGKTLTPFARETELVIEFPESEVSLISLLQVRFNTRLRTITRSAKLSIMWILGCIKINTIRSLVSKSFCLKSLDKPTLILQILTGVGEECTFR